MKKKKKMYVKPMWSLPKEGNEEMKCYWVIKYNSTSGMVKTEDEEMMVQTNNTRFIPTRDNIKLR